jgi:crotonobetainyl-CoA:carnitine CoA-transferase CaiB-like acyl-CoA transferase
MSGPVGCLTSSIEAAGNPDLITASLTSFGPEGPHASFRSSHLTAYAMSGLMMDQGDPGSVPIVMPGIQMFDEAGIQAAFGILTALMGPPNHGGETITVATHEILSSQMHHILRYGLFGAVAERTSGAVAPPSGTWRLADGVVSLQVFEPRQWVNFVRILGNPPELQASSLEDRIFRREARHWLEPFLVRTLKGLNVEDFVDRANAAGVPCSKVNQATEVWDDRQLRDRGFFCSVLGPGGEVEHPGAPYRLPSGWWRLARPAPGLGEHNQDVYIDELGFSDADLTRWAGCGLI